MKQYRYKSGLYCKISSQFLRHQLDRIAWLHGIILFACAPLAAADGIKLVVAQDVAVSSMNREDAANLFLGIGHSNAELIPFDRRDPHLRERFYREVTGMSAASVRAHWAKRVFTGRGRPPAMLSQKEVQQTLREKTGAVTYTSNEQLLADSKVLLSIESGEEQ